MAARGYQDWHGIRNTQLHEDGHRYRAVAPTRWPRCEPQLCVCPCGSRQNSGKAAHLSLDALCHWLKKSPVLWVLYLISRRERVLERILHGKTFQPIKSSIHME